jgi:predicted dehydrogenase
MVNVAIVGCGYWGINYVRTFGELPTAKVVFACDANPDRLRAVRERFPLISTISDWREAVSNKWVDAAVIATPAAGHLEIAKAFLEAGKHVLVEKPITTTVEDGAALVRTATENNRVLMTGHTFLYNPGVRKVKDLMADPAFGKVYYLHATRTNMGPFRQDVSVMWDLASHDIAIFNYLLDRQPQWVSAVGAKVLGNPREDVGFATLGYPGGVLAHVHAGWVNPNKVREVVVVGSAKRIVFDDLNNSERVRIFERGVAPEDKQANSFGEFRLLVRDGDVLSPRVETSEPLKNQAVHFIECVTTGKRPLSDGENGLAVIRALVAIDKSLAQHGAPVDVV